VRPVSDAFLRTVRTSHAITLQAKVLTSYQEGVSPTGTDIVIEGGDVTLDATAQVRGTLNLLTDGNGWDPRPGRHILQPYGNEIWIARGVNVGGSFEIVSQGYYRMQEVNQDTAPDGQLTITGSDRMQGIIDAQLPVPVTFAATATAADVFATLAGQVYPSVTIDFDWAASSDVLGSAQVTTEDRYGFLSDLATSRGKVMYFDYQGHLAVRDRPDPGVAVWDVNAGAGGVLITASRTLTRDNVCNAVIVTADGADTSAPPLAVAYDGNPGSPTYYYGTFGKVPEFWSSPLVTTAAQAQAAAALILARAVGLPVQADFSAVPNPALEPLDVVSVTYPAPAAADAALVIGQITIPLTAADPLAATAYNASSLTIALAGGAP
jgi:hypothetical protein